MSIDLSWLWGALEGVTATIQNFFSGIWTEIQAISNTGQGIFSGLVAFGTQIWDAFIKGLTALGEWLGTAFNWIYQGLKYCADQFGQWFATAMGWIGSGVAWMGTQLYNFGNWIWNGVQYGIQYLWAGLQGVWNAIVTFFGNLGNAFFTWWGDVTTSLNNWWTSVIVGIRNKIKQSIMASVTIMMSWKAGETFLSSMMDFDGEGKSLLKMGGSFLGILSAPIVGAVVAEVINAVIPTPTTTALQIVPTISAPTFPTQDLTITPPSIPSAPYSTPEGTAPPIPPGLGYGLPLDMTLSLKQTLTYDSTLITNDGALDLELSLTYESEVA